MSFLRSLPRPASCLLLLGATLVAGWPLLTRDKLPQGEDLLFAAQMTQGMLEGLRDGHLYPSWVDSMTLGYGAPAFCFYPPLAYYPSALVAALTGDVAQALRVVVLGGLLLSALSFFFSVRPLTSELGAAVGAACYLLLPYHLLDLYDRWAFAELAGFVWLPLVFRFTRDCADRPGWGPALGLTASYAGLVMTHLISAYLLLLALVPYAGCRVVRRPGRSRRLAWMGTSGAVAVLLSAVYLAPVVLERDEVHFEFFVESSYGDWRQNFAFAAPPESGFGPEAIAPAINVAVASTLLFALVSTGLLLLRFPSRDAPRSEGLLYAGLSVWVVLLQTPASSPVWRWVPYLGTAQFPWRFGTLQVLLASFLAALVLAPRDDGAAPGRWLVMLRRRVPIAAAAALVLAAVPALIVSVRFVERREYGFDDALARHPITRAMAKEEYVPRTAEREKVFDPRHDLGQPIRILGRGWGRMVGWSSHGRRVLVDLEVPGSLLVRTFVYPGWEAWLDGERVPIQPVPPLGLIGVAVPAGRHQVEILFTPTPARLLGAAVSKATLTGVLAGGLAFLVLRRRRAACSPGAADRTVSSRPGTHPRSR